MDSCVVEVPGHVGVELLAACLWFIDIYVGEGRVTFVAVVLGFCLLWIIGELVYGSILVTV